MDWEGGKLDDAGTLPQLYGSSWELLGEETLTSRPTGILGPMELPTCFAETSGLHLSCIISCEGEGFSTMQLLLSHPFFYISLLVTPIKAHGFLKLDLGAVATCVCPGFSFWSE